MYIDFSRQDFEKAEIDRHLLEKGEQIQSAEQKEYNLLFFF